LLVGGEGGDEVERSALVVVAFATGRFGVGGETGGDDLVVAFGESPAQPCWEGLLTAVSGPVAGVV
jgi:hypothetical protein